MPHFEVQIVEYQTVYIEVEAETPEEAKVKARSVYVGGDEDAFQVDKDMTTQPIEDWEVIEMK